ncbi:MAG: hypothetical protein QOE38_649 [Thermoleophilaceae bacterium]|nr:hypothetical protein [Thermoleophilaceae bacterium]
MTEEDEGIRDRISRQGEEALGRIAEELAGNPLVVGALQRAFEAREKATQAQEAAMGALGIPSAADIERLTRRLRSVSQRLEGIEDSVDRLDERLGSIADRLGELLAVAAALAEDGASRALGADGRVEPDPGVLAALIEAAGATAATVVSTDLFYDPRDGLPERWVAEGARAVEMEAAALFSVARRRGVRAGCLLAVTDLLVGERERMDQDGVDALGEKLGAAGLRALAALRPR